VDAQGSERINFDGMFVVDPRLTEWPKIGGCQREEEEKKKKVIRERGEEKKKFKRNGVKEKEIKEMPC
jgi:hypothetical protein